MAHFAELDKDNKVLRVVSVDDSHVSADMAIDGETWCANNIVEDPAIAYVDGAYPGVAWKQCSYNHNFRKRMAAVDGHFVDDGGDGYFVMPKPYANWVLNASGGWYEPPTPLPSTTTYTDGANTFQYLIHWDQDNTRYFATKVEGTDDTGWWRNKVTGADTTEMETVSSPTDEQKATLIWDPSNSTWN